MYGVNSKRLNHIDQGFCSCARTFLRPIMKPKQDVSQARRWNSKSQSSTWLLRRQRKVLNGAGQFWNEKTGAHSELNSNPPPSYGHYKHRHRGNYPECSMSSEHKGLLIAPFCKWNMARSHSPTTPWATSLVSVSCHKCIIGFIINIIGRSACWLGYSLMSCVARLNLWKEKLNAPHQHPPELLFVSIPAQVFRQIQRAVHLIMRCSLIGGKINEILQHLNEKGGGTHKPKCSG